jgi:hypothetical protein
VEFTLPKLRRLRKALKRAKAEGKGRQDTFMFDGNEYVVGYAEYLVEYLNMKLLGRSS